MVLPAFCVPAGDRGCDQSAVGPVFGFVHCNHCVVERRAHELADDVRRVGLVVAQHCDDFVVAEHADPRIAIERRGCNVVRKRPLELNRPLAASGRETGIGILDGAELDGVRQLERVEIPSSGTHPDRHLNSPCATDACVRATLRLVRFCIVSCILESIRRDGGYVKGVSR
jgi:hypothetical protein